MTNRQGKGFGPGVVNGKELTKKVMVSLTRFMNSLGDKNVFPLLGTGRVPFMGDLSPFKEEEQRGSRGLRVIDPEGIK